MRWIDIELPATGTNQKLDRFLDEATALTAEIPQLQRREGLDSVVVTARMAQVGQRLFQAVTAAVPDAFRPDEKRSGAHIPSLGLAEVDGLVGYHIVAAPAQLALPWSWLHNAVGFLLETYPLCAGPASSLVPEATAPRAWMQRYSEQLFRSNGDGHLSPHGGRRAAGTAAVPEIFFVPGHCQERIRRLIYREADGIRSTLVAAGEDRARLHIPDAAVTPLELVNRALMYQVLHYAGPTSQPPQLAAADEGWVNELMADAETAGGDRSVEELVGLEREAVGVDPIEALLDQITEAYELTEPPPEPVAAAGGPRPASAEIRTDDRAGEDFVSAADRDRDPPGRERRASGAAAHASWLLDDGPVRPESMAHAGTVPPLVFSNSYLSLPTLGARFLEAGASAFVGPVAPLFSRPARRYAGRFYDFLADGLCAGAALRAAALALREEYGPEHPAWLSYGMYGYGALALQYL